MNFKLKMKLLASFMLISLWAVSQTEDPPCQIIYTEPENPLPLSNYSPNGKVFTPKGDLRILTIFATIDIPSAPNVGSQPVSGWSSTNPFPNDIVADPKTYIYNNVNDFGSNYYNLSEYYYQMSHGQFRLFGDIISINFDPTSSNSDFSYNTSSWADCNRRVMTKMMQEYPAFDWSPYDNRTNKPYYTSDNSISSQDYKPDYVVIIYRYSKGEWTSKPAPNWPLQYSGGAYSTLNNLGGISYNGYTFDGAGFTMCTGVDLPQGQMNLFIHELAHELHDCPHQTSVNGVIGQRWNFPATGHGMVSNYAKMTNTANAWDSWVLGWIELTTGSTQVNTDIQSSSSLQNGGIYSLRDFATTGDVVRIKIPNTSNEYIWLENHQVVNMFDHKPWAGQAPSPNGELIPDMEKGLYVYKENILGDRNNIWNGMVSHMPSVNAIEMISARGNKDYIHSEFGILDWAWYWKNPVFTFEEASSNPIDGVNHLQRLPDDYPDTITSWPSNNVISYSGYNNSNGGGSEAHSIIRETNTTNTVMTYANLGGLNYEAANILNKRTDAFKQGDELSLSGIAPLLNYPIYSMSQSKKNPSYLNGLNIQVLSENSSTGEITIQISFDDYEVRNDKRWCGNIILPSHPNGITNYSLNLKNGKKLEIDKSGTPNRHTLTADNDFINPTVFTCESGSYFHAEVNATVNVINGSSLHLKSGSKLELEAGATLHIDSNSLLKIYNGAELYLKPGAKLIIDDGASLLFENSTTNKGLLVGSTSYTGNPAIVEVHGSITLNSSAKWIHNRDGFYRFHPTSSVSTLSVNQINFTGKGKTRKMVELANNTTLSISSVGDMDWNTGLIHYGSNSKIVLEDVNFTSISCTYNPASNPQTTSTAVELIEPRATFLNGCDFNKLNKGVVVRDADAAYLVHVQTGKFTDMTTYGIELDNVDNFKMTNGFVDGAVTGLYAYDSEVIELSGAELKNATYGAGFENVAGAYFTNHANVHDNGIGIYATASLVFLRNGARAYDNINGVEIYGAYDSGLGNYNTMLTMGDIGCGSVYNNSNYGIFGIDALLNIDAVQHSIDRGDYVVKPNRFDNNAYKTFEICYGSSTYAPSQINAKGNFWGVSPPDIDSTQYTFVANVCAAQGGTPVYIPLIHTDYSTCVPTTSCMDCSSGGGGGSSSSSSMMAVQSSFSEANEVFVEEDNAATRNGFTNLSAVELIKDTVLDTWKGKSVSNVLFSLEKESVHLIQVSKAIKAKANNSTGRMMYIVEDVFKDVTPESLGVSSTVSLYPNPTNDVLFIDVERVDNYSLVIYNLSGQKVLEQTLTDKHNLVNVNSLPVGTYFYELSAPNSNTVKGNIAITK